MRRAVSLWIALLAAVVPLFAVAAPVWSAGPSDSSHVVVLQDDGRLLTPANPLPFAGRTLRYLPTANGGYQTQLATGRSAALALPVSAMQPLALAGGSAELPLRQAFRFFGRSYGSVFVHTAGTVSFGEALPESSAPRAAAGGDLLRGLTAGPPVVAALWNELVPSSSARVLAAELDDRVVIAWVDFPSTRPAGQPNTFRVGLFFDGHIEVGYERLSTSWGIAGISPGRDRDHLVIADLATAPEIGAREAVLAWYHDLPTLNEIEVARAALERVPDRFEFLTAFTTQPVDGPSLVSSTTVKNTDRGIGRPLFDHGAAFGSSVLEHVAILNDLAFYDDDPTRPPRLGTYAYAPSTLAVLAHEVGHRWLANARLLGTDLAGEDGHWSFTFDSGASLLGGNALRDNGDGTFTTAGALARFGPLDQYLMGLRAPEDVGPLLTVDGARDFDPTRSASGRPFDAGSRPETGVTFHGEPHAFSIADVEAQLGARVPDAASAPRSFRMAFVLVTPRGMQPTAEQLEKIDRIRREFGPYFRQVSDGRARMKTWLPVPTSADASAQIAPRPVAPQILHAAARRIDGGRTAVKVDYAAADADLGSLAITPEATATPAPTTVDLTAGAYGRHTGSFSLVLRDLPSGVASLRLELIDAHGRHSAARVATLVPAS